MFTAQANSWKFACTLMFGHLMCNSAFYFYLATLKISRHNCARVSRTALARTGLVDQKYDLKYHKEPPLYLPVIQRRFFSKLQGQPRASVFMERFP